MKNHFIIIVILLFHIIGFISGIIFCETVFKPIIVIPILSFIFMIIVVVSGLIDYFE